MVPETQGGGFGQFQRFQAIITGKRERERERSIVVLLKQHWNWRKEV